MSKIVFNLKSKTQKRPRRLKWGGLFAIVVALAVCGARAEAQQAGKVARIGFLDNSTAAGSAVLVDAFRQEMRKLGWIEGKNITIEYRFAEQKDERLPELAADLVRLKIDLIVVTGGPAALAAKGATSTIPIVIAQVGDPVGQGLVASLARPGGNVTGLSSLIELNQKARDPQGRSIQARPSWTSGCAEQHISRSPTERAQGCGSGTKAKIGGDRDSIQCQRFRERLSNRKGEAGGRDYDAPHAPLFRRKKADRRACR